MSKVWKLFDKIDDISAKCKICQKKLSTKGRSTSGLLNHLKAVHSKEFNALDKDWLAYETQTLGRQLTLEDIPNTVSKDQCDQQGSNFGLDVAENTVTPSGSSKKKHDDTRIKLQKGHLLRNAMKTQQTPADSQQIFANYVAHQMRNMTKAKQKRLKLMIQKAIFEVEDGPEDINMASFAPVSPISPHLTQFTSQMEEPQGNNIFGQLPNPDANTMWREHFAFNSEKNVNTCLVEITGKPCGQEVMGDHASHLAQHIKRQHGDIVDRLTRKKIKKEPAHLKNTEAADNYVIINEAELDSIYTDFDYDPLREEPNTNFSGKETAIGQQNVEINNQHSLSCDKQRPIKREMIEEIDLEPKRVCTESTTSSEDETIQTDTEEKNVKDIIDTIQITTFIFKGEEYVQMPKEHYLQEKRHMLSELLRFESIINNTKLRLNVTF